MGEDLTNILNALVPSAKQMKVLRSAQNLTDSSGITALNSLLAQCIRLEKLDISESGIDKMSG